MNNLKNFSDSCFSTIQGDSSLGSGPRVISHSRSLSSNYSIIALVSEFFEGNSGFSQSIYSRIAANRLSLEQPETEPEIYNSLRKNYSSAKLNRENRLLSFPRQDSDISITYNELQKPDSLQFSNLTMINGAVPSHTTLEEELYRYYYIIY